MMTWRKRTMAMVALTGLLYLQTSTQSGATEAGSSVQSQGKTLAFSRQKGNCLSCHAIDGGELSGNIGPALVDLQLRYEDKAALRAQIWDATSRNPATGMPPYGRHRILTEVEIDKIVEYIWLLRGQNR